MRILPLDFFIVFFLYGTFHNSLWLEPFKWNLLTEILIPLILHMRFVRIWKSRNCSVTTPISIYSLLNTCCRLACPSQSPELPEINYLKFKYTAPHKYEVNILAHKCVVNITGPWIHWVTFCFLLSVFLPHPLFTLLTTCPVFPFCFRGEERKWEEHVLWGRRDGKQHWEEMMVACKESTWDFTLKIL